MPPAPAEKPPALEALHSVARPGGLPSAADAGSCPAPRPRPGSSTPAGDRQPSAGPAAREPRFSAAELEFMDAMNAYKQASGRMFPTWSEVLEVLKGIGYSKVCAGEPPSGSAAG